MNWRLVSPPRLLEARRIKTVKRPVSLDDGKRRELVQRRAKNLLRYFEIGPRRRILWIIKERANESLSQRTVAQARRQAEKSCFRRNRQSRVRIQHKSQQSGPGSRRPDNDWHRMD